MVELGGGVEMFVWFTAPADPTCQYVGPQLIDGVIDQGDVRCHATLRVWVWGGDTGVDPVVGPLPDDSNLNESLSSSSTSDSFGLEIEIENCWLAALGSQTLRVVLHVCSRPKHWPSSQGSSMLSRSAAQ